MSYLNNRVSEIRDLINDKNGENFLSDKDIELFLVELFGSSIQFCSSERKNESLMVFSIMVFSSEIELQDIVKKMRSLDSIKTAAATIRQSLLDLDFGLDDKFCDAEELKEASRKKVMPDVLLTFSTLFNLRLRNLLQGIDEGSCADLDVENGNDDTDQADMDERMESLFENQNFISSTEDKRKFHLLSWQVILFMINAKAENWSK